MCVPLRYTENQMRIKHPKCEIRNIYKSIEKQNEQQNYIIEKKKQMLYRCCCLNGYSLR